jgi:hypothetical protein
MFQRPEERFLNEVIGVGEVPGGGGNPTVRPGAKAGEITLKEAVASQGIPLPDPTQKLRGGRSPGGDLSTNRVYFQGLGPPWTGLQKGAKGFVGDRSS